jgi:endoglucanase
LQRSRRPIASHGLLAAILSLAAAAGCASPPPNLPVHSVKLSALGYFPERAKFATVTATLSPGTAFIVRRADTDGPVWSAPLTGPVVDSVSKDQVWLADFTEFCDKGSFYIEAAGAGKSTVFTVADDAYDQPYVMAMQGLYGARCGTAVELSDGTDTWQHGACHMKDAYLNYLVPGSTAISPSIGGWHDAGDYGKYVMNGAFTVGMLLGAWRDFQPALQAIPLSIPEHGGAIPDFLAEVKWELDWLLTTQQPDGSVVHKVTATDFETFILPEQDLSLRYYTGVGTSATGDFVAAMAAAARIYMPYDADFAARALTAAQAGYAFLTAHPENIFPDLSAFNTGKYTDSDDSDERLWAAAELWETTGDPAVLADVEARVTGQTVDDNFDWANVKNLGLFTYLRSTRAERNPDVVAALTAGVVQSAENLVTVSQGDAYGRAISFWWGSNGSVARTAMNLTTANFLHPDPRYLDAITGQVDHLGGRNVYDRSQITGLGYNPPRHPQHRPSAADAVVDPWPGLLVGGQDSAKAADWVDDQGVAGRNEVAINWNGALIYALAGFLK